MNNGNYYESHLLEAEMRPLQDRVQTLEDDPERLLPHPYDQTREPLSHGSKHNEKLAAALRAAKSQIVALKEAIDKLCAPPHNYGTFRMAHADGTIDVSVDGRTLKVNVHPTITIQELKAGQLLTLNSELAPFEGDTQRAVQALIKRIVEQMYAPTEHNEFLEVTYANGNTEIIYCTDFASGAMIQNIVARAKRALAGGEKGIRVQDLQAAVAGEYRENEDLPNTTDPDGWARISGRKGEKIINVRTLLDGRAPTWHAMEEISAGQYL
jgi:Proteasomal ATPase OB N-terminal domain